MAAPTSPLLCTELHDRTGAVMIMREDGSGLAIPREDVPRLIAQLREFEAAEDPRGEPTALNAT